MKQHSIIILLILVSGFSIPVASADQYLGGSPALTAYVAGIDEFSPGQDAQITVVIQNTGTYAERFVDHGSVAPDDLPTTAKLVTVGLTNGTAPIVVKTDPQDIRDIPSPSSVTVTFRTKITSNATSGEYQIPLTIHYKYFANSISAQPSSDMLSPVYREMTTVIPIAVKIKPVIKINVLNVTSDNLIAGTEGFLNLTIRNDGADDGKEASVILLRNGQSPIIPSDSSIYNGNFDQGQAIRCQYKVDVSNDARQHQTYPVDVQITYTNSEGKIVESTIETVGVPVGEKLGFIVTSEQVTIKPGESRVVEIDYQNTGSITAHKALARITLPEPFDSSDTMAYLGDVLPGQTAVGRYTISANNNAAPGTYQLDTNVRYRDSFDNSLISDTVETPVEIVPAKGAFSPIFIVGALVSISVIGIIAGLYSMKRRR